MNGKIGMIRYKAEDLKADKMEILELIYTITKI